MLLVSPYFRNCFQFLSVHLAVPHLKLLLFTGYLIGYLVHRKKDLAPTCADSMVRYDDSAAIETGAAPLMNWDKVKKLLAEQVSADKFDSVFR